MGMEGADAGEENEGTVNAEDRARRARACGARAGMGRGAEVRARDGIGRPIGGEAAGTRGRHGIREREWWSGRSKQTERRLTGNIKKRRVKRKQPVTITEKGRRGIGRWVMKGGAVVEERDRGHRRHRERELAERDKEGVT